MAIARYLVYHNTFFIRFTVSSGVHCPLGVICISKKDRPFVKNGVHNIYFLYVLHILRVYVLLHTFTIFLTEVVRLQIQSLILWNILHWKYTNKGITFQAMNRQAPSVFGMCEYSFRLVLSCRFSRVERGIISINTNDIRMSLLLHNNLFT